MKKYAFWVKCLTFALCVVLLLSVAVSGLGVLLAGGMGMYNHTNYNEWITDNYYQIAEHMAQQLVYGLGGELSKSPQWLLEQYGYTDAAAQVSEWYDLSGNDWYYIVEDATGKVIRNTQNANVSEPIVFGFQDLTTSYPVIVSRAERELPTTTPPENEDPSWPAEASVTEQTVTPTIVAEEFTHTAWDPYNGEEVHIRFVDAGSFHVTVGISKNYAGYRNYSGLPQSMLKWLFSARMTLIAIIAVSFCLFAAAFVLLVMIAGKDPRTGEANPKALNRLPLDLYLAAGIFGTILGCLAAYELMDLLFYEKGGYNLLIILLLCGCGVAVATLDMGFFTALAAQCKMQGHFWWHNSICGRLLRWLWKGIRFCSRCAMNTE